MRNSNILKWGNNNKNNKLSLGSGGKNNNPDKSKTSYFVKTRLRKRSSFDKHFLQVCFFKKYVNRVIPVTRPSDLLYLPSVTSLPTLKFRINVLSAYSFLREVIS